MILGALRTTWDPRRCLRIREVQSPVRVRTDVARFSATRRGSEPVPSIVHSGSDRQAARLQRVVTSTVCVRLSYLLRAGRAARKGPTPDGSLERR